jgi:multiple sugar transport system permease protein
VLTYGGPRNTTDLFGTWAFKLGIGSGDIPLAAAVSLFLFPLLAILAIFILRDVSRRTREI